jgi:hypothetical protein
VGPSGSIKNPRTTAQEPNLKSWRWGKAVPISSISTVLAYSVEKLDSRFSGDDFGGLKPSPDQFAWL